VGFHLAPEIVQHWVDVETDPAIVLTGIATWRGLEVPSGWSCAVKHDVVILAWIPPQIIERRNLQILLLAEPSVLGGVERLVVLDADTAAPNPVSSVSNPCCNRVPCPFTTQSGHDLNGTKRTCRPR
jgi:hypothetical protein